MYIAFIIQMRMRLTCTWRRDPCASHTCSTHTGVHSSFLHNFYNSFVVQSAMWRHRINCFAQLMVPTILSFHPAYIQCILCVLNKEKMTVCVPFCMHHFFTNRTLKNELEAYRVYSLDRKSEVDSLLAKNSNDPVVLIDARFPRTYQRQSLGFKLNDPQLNQR